MRDILLNATIYMLPSLSFVILARLFLSIVISAFRGGR